MIFETKTLGELSIDGKGAYGIGAPAVPYSDNLYTYLRITDINDDGTLNDSDFKSVDDEKAADYILKPNDIVFARTGASTGRNYFYDGSDGEFVYAGFLIKFSINPMLVNPKYVKYYCLSQKYQDWVKGFNTGSTRGNINAKTLGGLPIPLPPRTQQDEVVSFLEILDEKIKNLKVMNKNLEQQVLAIYKKEFIENKTSVLETCAADKCFEISIGKTPPRKESQWFSEDPSDVVWISISDMGDSGMFIAESSEYLTKEAVDKFNVRVIPENTVVLSFKLTVGRVSITDVKATTNEAIAHFVTETEGMREYLYCYLKMFDFNSLGSTSSIATAVNSKIIKSMPFDVPKDDKLNEFSNVVEPLFERVKNNLREMKKLYELRKVLLSKMISGEISFID